MIQASEKQEAKPTIHGTVVDVDGRGILIRGEPGSGKSALALRLIDEAQWSSSNTRLVADDRVFLSVANGELLARTPEPIAGLIEIRGVGIIELPFCEKTRIALVVDLIPAEKLERLPDAKDQKVVIEGVDVAHVSIAARNPDAAAIIRTMMRVLSTDPKDWIA